MGVREAQKLVYASGGLQGQCGHRRLLVGKDWQVESMWLGMQLDYDEEMGPLHGMYGSVEAELDRGPAHHQEGGADRFLMPFTMSDWASQGPCR